MPSGSPGVDQGKLEKTKLAFFHWARWPDGSHNLAQWSFHWNLTSKNGSSLVKQYLTTSYGVQANASTQAQKAFLWSTQVYVDYSDHRCNFAMQFAGVTKLTSWLPHSHYPTLSFASWSVNCVTSWSSPLQSPAVVVLLSPSHAQPFPAAAAGPSSSHLQSLLVCKRAV